jgi:uncharacterized protein YccT (UPF0319 family)
MGPKGAGAIGPGVISSDPANSFADVTASSTDVDCKMRDGSDVSNGLINRAS